MIFSSDPEYKETKLVKQGVKTIDLAFQDLANWINIYFKTAVLNIYYDKIKPDKNRPRLSIVFENHGEAEKFKDKIGNYDDSKQKLISDKFKELQDNEFHKQNYLKKIFSSKQFDTNRLYVIFTSFEPIAREEANKNIPESRIEELQAEIGMEDLWMIYRQFSITTFFFNTDNQLEKYSSDGTTDFLKLKYYDLLKQYDEFDYIKPDTYFIKYDSKENFDKNYQSSWFYYSR
jgi:hypothetical protein